MVRGTLVRRPVLPALTVVGDRRKACDILAWSARWKSRSQFDGSAVHHNVTAGAGPKAAKMRRQDQVGVGHGHITPLSTGFAAA